MHDDGEMQPYINLFEAVVAIGMALGPVSENKWEVSKEIVYQLDDAVEAFCIAYQENK